MKDKPFEQEFICDEDGNEEPYNQPLLRILNDYHDLEFLRTQLPRSIWRTSSMPSKVRIVEVGARDGLQNEGQFVPTDVKIEFIGRLVNTGLTFIEATSFVSPKWVPQMSDHQEVTTALAQKDFNNVTFPVLVPNMKGLEKAIKSGAREISVFASASDGFSKKNINCSVQESLERFQTVIEVARTHKLRVRGYISCVIACPYDGPTRPKEVARIAKALYDMGCYEISLADTTGVGTPASFKNMLHEVLKELSPDVLAVHCHDTYGQALANILTALKMNISVFDSSAAGLGGCPYAKGATGNVATEDVLYMLHELGIETGVDLGKVVDAGNFISQKLGRKNSSRVAIAMTNKV